MDCVPSWLKSAKQHVANAVPGPQEGRTSELLPAKTPVQVPAETGLQVVPRQQKSLAGGGQAGEGGQTVSGRGVPAQVAPTFTSVHEPSARQHAVGCGQTFTGGQTDPVLVVPPRAAHDVPPIRIC